LTLVLSQAFILLQILKVIETRKIEAKHAYMRRRMNEPTLAFVLVFLLVVTAAGQEPKPLVEFSLPKLDGQTLRSEELKDNIVVLDFWATWCENCVGEIPAFNRLQEKYSSHGVKVIGMAVQSGWASDIQKFAVQYKMRYTILVGNDDTVSDFGVISFPATYVIAPVGSYTRSIPARPRIRALTLSATSKLYSRQEQELKRGV